MSSKGDDYNVNTINIAGDPIRSERLASAVITPGMLVELGSADEVAPYSDADEAAHVGVAFEDDLQGKSITDVYAVDSLVQFNSFKRGEIFNGLLANGQTVVIGDKVTSNGDGRVKKATTEDVVGIVLKAVDMSDSSAADPDGRVPVLVV